MSELIRKAARKWFYESFDCDLLAQMQEKGLIDQAEGFSVSVMAELELEMESAFLSFQAELVAMKAERDALQQRLTVAEQRESDLKKLLCDVINEAPTGFSALKVDLAHRVNYALKPAAGSAPIDDQWEK